MQRGVFFVLALVVAGCGLRRPGGAADGCNAAFDEGHRVIEGPVAFSSINALAFDGDGYLYVANRTSGGSYLLVFGPSPKNEYVRAVGRGALRDLVDFVRVPEDGSFWALQDRGGPSLDPEVVHLDAEGAVLSRFPVTTDNVGGIARAADGSLYVSYYRVAKLDPTGTLLDTFGSKPNGQPFYQGLAFDSAGKLWVTDLMESSLERFDVASGERIAHFGGRGAQPGKFDGTNPVHAGPTDLAFDEDGNLYVNDPYGSRIMKLDTRGTMLGELGFGGADNIEPIAIDPRTGNVYVGRDTGIDIVCPL